MSKTDILKLGNGIPIVIRPPLFASSPAIIRKVVVFPQPLGPSSVTNLPSRHLEADVAHGNESAEGAAYMFEPHLRHRGPPAQSANSYAAGEMHEETMTRSGRVG
ncbi:unnamed protein product [uncultured bacterium]|nr:unnamed protein product [uncultured bacterium]